jgi:hypothetical protein
VFDKVIRNLEDAIAMLKEEDLELKTNKVTTELTNGFIELKKIRIKELQKENTLDDKTFQLKMQEAQLVIEQLTWLTNLSENIMKTTQVLIKTENELQ